MDQTNPKWWLNSLTVRGALLAGAPVVTALLSLFGVKIGNDEVNAVVDGIVGLIGAVGVVLAIIGRIKAQVAVKFQEN